MVVRPMKELFKKNSTWSYEFNIEDRQNNIIMYVIDNNCSCILSNVEICNIQADLASLFSIRPQGIK